MYIFKIIINLIELCLIFSKCFYLSISLINIILYQYFTSNFFLFVSKVNVCVFTISNWLVRFSLHSVDSLHFLRPGNLVIPGRAQQLLLRPLLQLQQMLLVLDSLCDATLRDDVILQLLFGLDLPLLSVLVHLHLKGLLLLGFFRI